MIREFIYMCCEYQRKLIKFDKLECYQQREPTLLIAAALSKN